MPQDDNAYDRGHAAGEIAGDIAARLNRHDDHFTRINGSLEKMVLRFEEMIESDHTRTLAIQRLIDQQATSAREVVTTAKALKDTVDSTATALKEAADARRTQTEQSFTPWQRLGVGVLIVSGLIAVIVGIKQLIG